MSSSTRRENPNETSADVSQIQSLQQKQRAAVPQIEVVNEIQIVINKKENQQRSLSIPTPSDSKDIRKCVSSRSSKTDITAVTTATTATLDTTTSKHVTIKNGRRSSREKDKSESNSSICVCGKLLKRVKGLLEKKDKSGAGEFSLSL